MDGPQTRAMLDARVALIQSNVYAESTKRTYNSYLSVYKQFCFQNSIPLAPISSKDLGRYIAVLSLKYKYSSISNYLSVVRLVHLEQGLSNPLESHYISNLKKGTRRLLGDQASRKLPITPALLMAIFSQLSMSSPLHVAFWAACTVAFFSFFRKSNLLPESPRGSQHKFITRGDISFSSEGALINVNWSKTIQYKQRVLTIPLPFIPNSPLCPSGSLFMSMNLCPQAGPQSSPFTYKDHTGLKNLTYTKFLTILKNCLKNLHIDSQKYSGHSFRRGGATFALECGAPGELIQTQGDWRSNAYQLYLDPSFDLRRQVSHLMTQSISQLSFST